jgi:hypothetical protein
MESLSRDLLLILCAFCPVQTFVQMTSTCKALSVLRADDTAWKVIDQTHQQDSLTTPPSLDAPNLDLIARWVTNSSYLAFLTCQRNAITDITSLSKALETNRSVTSVDLEGNFIRVWYVTVWH